MSFIPGLHTRLGRKLARLRGFEVWRATSPDGGVEAWATLKINGGTYDYRQSIRETAMRCNGYERFYD